MDSLAYVADLAQDVADVACGCLDATTAGAPSECTVYWSTPPDDMDCGDCGTNGALIVWLSRVGVTESFPQVTAQPVGRANVRPTAELQVRLIRPCWPAVGDTDMPSPLPSRDVTADYAASLMEDAVAVFCCLLAEAKDRAGIFGGCKGVSLGALTPDRNRGKCAGFTMAITVDLGACCTPTAGS